MIRRSMILLAVSILILFFVSTANAQVAYGPWSGYWHSGANQHRGRLNATFQQVSPTQLQANFRGTFAKVIPFRYRTKLNIVHQSPGLTLLAGSRKLPLSGEFRYQAEISNGVFHGTFGSRRNRGTMVMRLR